MTRLSSSVARASEVLSKGDLSGTADVLRLLELTHERRHLDLSDLPPQEQASLVEGSCERLQPSAGALASRAKEASRAGRSFVAKFGIDPTGAEVHLGHAVPMLLLSRFQRMGHLVVFIVGDGTARIGDPSGRSDERPHLSDEDIARNMATYQDQVAPFFDFSKAEFRHNGDWLDGVTLPKLIAVTSHIPVSMSLQREDFRTRLAEGHPLSLAELLYSVAMALDSVEVNCDLEVGGLDQYLNMQMCRKVMEICGQEPELVAATPLIEGTDGTGAKMSKSRGNYVPLTAPPGEVFGKLMSVPDRLVEPYLKALSEWQPAELAIVAGRLHDGSLHPMDLKRIMAGEITAALHGLDAAMKAREEFAAQFSSHRYGQLEDLPEVTDIASSVTQVVKGLGFAASNGEVRRIAEQNGLRIIVEPADGGLQEQVPLKPDDLRLALSELIRGRVSGAPGDCYLRVGRKLARIHATWPRSHPS
ncbi:MAG TPA: tyrosine--tRNA ligase [Acidimicrobiales bacterium]|nr:tyrosine--tRNA ligase [Acidimicrobiales bacterium]